MGLGPALNMFGVELQKIFMGAGIYTPFLFIALYALRPLVLFPASIMTITSVFLFGVYGGFIVSYVGEMLSAVVAFFVGKYFGKELGLADKVKQTKIGNYFHSNTFISVIVLRLVPVFPFDFVNYASGVINIKFKPYIYGTLLGVLPGLSAYIFLGFSIMNTEYLLYAIILFVILIVGGNYSKKYLKKGV